MLNEEQLNEVEELAGYFFTEEEIREITGIQDREPAFAKAMRKGQLKAEAEVRKGIVELAKAGSSPAQTLAWKMIENLKRNEY